MASASAASISNEPNRIRDTGVVSDGREWHRLDLAQARGTPEPARR